MVAGELAAGVLLLAGVQVRLVSLATLPLLIGALAGHMPNGWVFSAPNGGWEYPAFLIVLVIVQALIGEGAYALRWNAGSRLAYA